MHTFGLQERREKLMKTFRVMLKTELKLSLRGMDMLIFAIIMPLVVLLIIGMILAVSPHSKERNIRFWISLLVRLPRYRYVQGE